MNKKSSKVEKSNRNEQNGIKFVKISENRLVLQITNVKYISNDLVDRQIAD